MARLERAATTSPALALLLVAACVAGQKPLAMEACKDDGSTAFTSVTISPCDSEPCSIKKGESYNVTFSAESSSDAKYPMLSWELKQKTNTSDVNIVSSMNCILTNIPCNLTKGEVLEGSAPLRIQGFFGTGEVFYQLKVSAPMMKTLVCGQTKLQVVEGTAAPTQAGGEV